MAKNKSMPLNEAIQEVLAKVDDSPLRGLLELACQQALEVEIADHLGAEPYERTSDRRGYRNGYKPRTLTTAVGDLNLLVPQDREGTFSTQLFERYQRSDKALVLALMEMYVKGVSTRKVAAITEKLCGKSFSSQQVSKLAKDLDAHVESWRTRPLEGDRPYLLVDARYEKVRINGRVISQGILIVIAINPEGKREIVAVEIADTENATTWSELFKSLKRRGLAGVKMVTSDDHEGIKAAVKRHFQGASWQRCQCHFIGNVLPLAPKGSKKKLHADLRTIFDSDDIEAARENLAMVLNRWSQIRADVAEKLDSEIEDCLSCFYFPEPHRKRIRTTNCPERFNQEIKRRTRVVRIFPNRTSALRLIGAVCMEQSDEWETGRRYLDVSLLDGWEFEQRPEPVLVVAGK
jgi:transposase-like protein